MAIEVVSKVKIKAPRWASILFIVGFVALIFLLASYVYFGQASQTLSAGIQEKEDLLRLTLAEQTLEEKMRIQERKINQFDNLLADHRKTINLFEFLEQRSHPLIWISEFGFNTSRNMINISGEAQSFVALGQQILVLKGDSLIKTVQVADISLAATGKITFALQLVFDPEIFTLLELPSDLVTFDF